MRQDERATELAKVDCHPCNGNGFSQFEDPCQNCGGERTVKARVYSDCGHEVESEDCLENGCMAGCAICGTIFVTDQKQDEPETGWDCGQHQVQEGKAAA